MLGIYMYNQLDDRGARPIVKTDSNRLKGRGRQGCFHRIVLKQGIREQGSPSVVRTYGLPKGRTGKGSGRLCFSSSFTHALTQFECNSQRTYDRGRNDAWGKIDDSWAELLIGRS